MLQKVFIKVSILFILLVFVFGISNYISSSNFKNSISEFFSLNSNSKKITWCPDHLVDFEWLDSDINPTIKAATIEQIKSQFCSLTMDDRPVPTNLKPQFKKLLIVRSAEAKVATLEWSPNSQLFQVQDLPFYSTILWNELKPEPK